MFINILSHFCNILGKRLVLNILRLVKTKTSLKTAKDRSFDNLKQWWTSLGLGPPKNGGKTGLDQTFKHYFQEDLQCQDMSKMLFSLIFVMC